jgi:hypothetical protein
MIDLYYWPTPNGHKITIFLEETDLDYKIVPVNIRKGEQFAPEFLKISPNNRMPAIIDHDGPGGHGDRCGPPPFCGQVPLPSSAALAACRATLESCMQSATDDTARDACRDAHHECVKSAFAAAPRNGLVGPGPRRYARYPALRSVPGATTAGELFLEHCERIAVV